MMKTSLFNTTKKCLGLLMLALMGIGTARAQVITFYTPRTVHVVKAMGEAPEQQSQVVIATPEKVKVNKQVDGETITYRTSELTVKVEQGRVSFFDMQGRLLVTENGIQINVSSLPIGTYLLQVGTNVVRFIKQD